MTPLPAIRYPRAPAHVQPYVETPGPALTVKFLLAFGGSPSLYFPADPKGKSAAEGIVGAAQLKALGDRFGQRVNVPVPRTWLIHALTVEGKSRAEVCRIVRCSCPTVARALRLPSDGSTPAIT